MNGTETTTLEAILKLFLPTSDMIFSKNACIFTKILFRRCK